MRCRRSGETLLDRVKAARLPVVAIGKIEDLFAGRGITRAIHTASDDEGMDQLERADGGRRSRLDLREPGGLRHRSTAIATTSTATPATSSGSIAGSPSCCRCLRPTICSIVTADHGNDPTTPSTDHSREYVPLLVDRARSVRAGVGSRHAAARSPISARRSPTIFGVGPLAHGTSFLRGDHAHDVFASSSKRASARSSRRRPRRAPTRAAGCATEAEDEVRPAFQRDRDRIIHCKAFRRLKHKTQVFFAPTGDHYRTRLTHTLEVSQIARTIAKVLRLHEELTEAIALGHDLGHTPFGHAGERVIDSLMPGGFNHYEQSLRIVDLLENDGRGLNLTWEVRDGIAKHSKGKSGAPVGDDATRCARARSKGQIMRVADLIAYVNHDIDDATRAGLLQAGGPAAGAGRGRWAPPRRRGSATLVKDVVTETLAGGLTEIRMSDPVLQAVLDLRSFLFDAVYENSIATAEFKKAADILSGLWEKVRERPDEFLDARTIDQEGLDAATRDFIAGMTDRYAVRLFEQLFIPKPWAIE